MHKILDQKIYEENQYKYSKNLKKLLYEPDYGL